MYRPSGVRWSSASIFWNGIHSVAASWCLKLIRADDISFGRRGCMLFGDVGYERQALQCLAVADSPRLQSREGRQVSVRILLLPLPARALKEQSHGRLQLISRITPTP